MLLPLPPKETDLIQMGIHLIMNNGPRTKGNYYILPLPTNTPPPATTDRRRRSVKMQLLQFNSDIVRICKFNEMFSSKKKTLIEKKMMRHPV